MNVQPIYRELAEQGNYSLYRAIIRDVDRTQKSPTYALAKSLTEAATLFQEYIDNSMYYENGIYFVESIKAVSGSVLIPIAATLEDLG